PTKEEIEQEEARDGGGGQDTTAPALPPRPMMDWEIANEPWYTEEDVDVQSANDRDRDSDSASDR
ncbi:hypothetical protein LTR28_003188, partial [Elasticomyces elasticus]